MDDLTPGNRPAGPRKPAAGRTGVRGSAAPRVAPRVLRKDLTCSPPHAVFIDICNLCGLRCPCCPTGRRERSFPHRVLTAERFAVLLERVAPFAETLTLHNWGEPFLNPELHEIITLAAGSGRRVHADSNFNFPALDRAAAERLVRSGLRSLHASIDGTSQTAYERYRVGGDLALAMHNLRRLAEARDRLRVPIELAWKFIVHRHNEHELEAAVRSARELGVPILFQLLSTDGDPDWLSSFHDRSDRLPPGAPLEVELAGEMFRIAWQNHVPTSRYLGRRDPALDPARPPRRRSFPVNIVELALDPRLPWCCRHPFETLYVNSDGSVTPCCTAWGTNMTVGNLLEQPFEEVWNGPAMRACRGYLLDPFSGHQGRSVCETQPCEFRDMAFGRR
ncbi:MAG: SPASM domain-containing protein [Deltaproteobacteria bacterium]|nr:SPASM domain-containing protein [Deltaproteobacteria bacterium]